MQFQPTNMADNVWIFFGFVLSYVAFAEGADYYVFPKKVSVKYGESFVLQVLPADTPLKSCTVRGGGANILLTPDGGSTNGMAYWGRGLESGDCGVKVEHNNGSTMHPESWVLQLVTVDNAMRSAFSEVTTTGSSEPPPPVQVLVEIGGDATLACASEDEAIYCKLKDPKGITISSGSNCTIKINNVKVTDGGTWKCVTGIRTAIQEQEAPIIVTVQPAKTLNITLEENARDVAIHCHLPISDMSYCRFQRPDGTSLIMSDGLSSNRYTYAGEGIQNNDCGVSIVKPLKEGDFGIWKCAIGLKDGTENGGFITINAPDKSTRAFEHTTTQPSYLYSIEGGSLTMDCTVDAALDYCWFQHPNGTRHYGLQESADSAAWRYHGEGLSLGHCGLTINQTEQRDSGKWICGMGIRGEPLATQDLVREFQVVIAATLLIESQQQQSPAHGEDATLSCHSLQGQALRYCRFTSPNGTGFNLFPQQIQTSNSRYVYQGTGLEYGECGILIKKVTSQDFGTWQCGARLIGNLTQELTRDLILSPPGITSSSAIGIAVALTVSALCVVGYVVYKRRQAALAQRTNNRPVAVSIASDGSDDILNLQIS